MKIRASLMPTGACPLVPATREFNLVPTSRPAGETAVPYSRIGSDAPPAVRNPSSGLNACMAAGIAMILGTSLSQGALSFSPGYSGASHLTHGNGDGIISYDWGSDGNLYYATVTGSYGFGGLHRSDGNATTTVMTATSDYAGASVVAIGSSIYFNDGNFPQSGIHQYSTVSGMEAATTGATHYSLGTDGSNLFLTGAPGIGADNYINFIAGGVLTGSSIPLANTGGASGPIAFDTDGNLFYASGFGDLRIYRWSASEVAIAISSGGSSPLSSAGHTWVDYNGYFQNPLMQDLYAGASSMVVDGGGNVILSLTNFGGESGIFRFNAAGDGSHQAILTSTTRTGELRMHDGGLFVSDGNQIVAIIPEPSACSIMATACFAGLLIRRRNS